MSEPSASRPQTGAAGAGGQPPLAVPTEYTSRRLVSLQCLRAIAALMVVMDHAIHQSPGFVAAWPLPTGAWQAGVDLFFVISGFVMVYVTNERERSARQFLAMRAARIIPVYWFYTLGSAAMLLIAPQLYRSNDFSVKHLVLSLFFIPHITAESGWSPVVKQGWTLNYEVFFYVLFAIAMAISVRHRTALSVGTLVAFSVAGHLMKLGHFPLGALGFYFQDIILEFAFGMLIATAFLRGKLEHIKAPVAAALVVLGFVTMFALPSDDLTKRAVFFGLPAALIVIGALAFEAQVPLKLRFLQSVGDASYSIYLAHIFPIAVLRAVWPLPMEGAVSMLLFVLTTFAAVIVVGRISYRFIEQTSLKYLRGVIQRRLG